jgi:hypothetical protein
MVNTSEQIHEVDLIDYEELYDELFSRMEQGIGAQIRPIPKAEDNGGDK